MYFSTRNRNHRVSFEQALLTGLAPDGGLYLPDSIPVIDAQSWKNTGTFPDLAHEVLSQWLKNDIPSHKLREIVVDAFNYDVPLVPLKGEGLENVAVLELFHGPTLSFKDFGARTMARLMAYYLSLREESLTILVATSGDTGSAVADGFSGQQTIDVVLLYPKGQVSPVQERQLIVERPGVTTFAVEGTFDDCQRMVKGAFVDEELFPYGLSSANSINIGRLLPQMLYYIWAVKQLIPQEPVICVPSGNLGNLTGGMLAALSGVPIYRFIAAHNANDFFPRHLIDETVSFASSVQTLSNAMDVGTPSNYERLASLLSHSEQQKRISGESVSDSDTIATMKRVYHATGYIVDPHTAVGLEATRRYKSKNRNDHPVVVVSTAHPAKFPDIVRSALGFEPKTPRRLATLWDRETTVETIAPTVTALKEQLLRRFS